MWLGSWCFHGFMAALMSHGTAWLKILRTESLLFYKWPCQEIIFTRICETLWCVRQFVLNLVGGKSVPGGHVMLSACSLCWDGIFALSWVFTVWWRRWLSTWLMCWRTAGTKCRRTYWLMEVRWWLQHSLFVLCKKKKKENITVFLIGVMQRMVSCRIMILTLGCREIISR